MVSSQRGVGGRLLPARGSGERPGGERTRRMLIWAGEKPVKSSRRATPTKRRVRRVTSSHTAKHHSFLRGGGHVGTPEGADVRGCALRVERGLCAGVHVLQIRLDLLEGQLVQPVVVDCAPLRGGIAAHASWTRGPSWFEVRPSSAPQPCRIRQQGPSSPSGWSSSRGSSSWMAAWPGHRSRGRLVTTRRSSSRRRSRRCASVNLAAAIARSTLALPCISRKRTHQISSWCAGL